jgi:hypothetical protein
MTKGQIVSAAVLTYRHGFDIFVYEGHIVGKVVSKHIDQLIRLCVVS